MCAISQRLNAQSERLRGHHGCSSLFNETPLPQAIEDVLQPYSQHEYNKSTEYSLHDCEVNIRGYPSRSKTTPSFATMTLGDVWSDHFAASSSSMSSVASGLW